jgi:PAS domain-containing protein
MRAQRTIILVASLVFFARNVWTQESNAPASQAVDVGSREANDTNAANNPIHPMLTVDLQNYFAPSPEAFPGRIANHRADGIYRWFQSRALPARDTEGRVTGWYMLLTDIDDRKRAEGDLAKAFEEKAKSETELQTIIDAIPQLITVTGVNGKFLYANHAFRQYTGFTNEEIRPETARVLRHPDDTEKVRARDAAH